MAYEVNNPFLGTPALPPIQGLAPTGVGAPLGFGNYAQLGMGRNAFPAMRAGSVQAMPTGFAMGRNERLAPKVDAAGGMTYRGGNRFGKGIDMRFADANSVQPQFRQATMAGTGMGARKTTAEQFEKIKGQAQAGLAPA